MEDLLSSDAVQPVLKRVATTTLRQEGRTLKGGDGFTFSISGQRSQDLTTFVSVTLWVSFQEPEWPIPLGNADAYSRFSAVWNLVKSDEDFEALVEDLRSSGEFRVDRSFVGARAFLLKEDNGFTLRLDRLALPEAE